MSSKPDFIHPTPWLKELTTLKPARWRWGRSIRAALGIGLPLAIGLMIDQFAASLWVSMGSLFQAASERDGPYSTIYHKLFISAPLGAAGFLMGYLGVLPWGVIVAIMASLAFISGIVSSYSSPLSVGSLQFLVMATVALGNPEISTFWQPALLLLGGCTFYGTMLGIEALFQRRRPGDEQIIAVINSLQALASRRADEQPAESQRQQVTTQMATLYAQLLETRYHALGRNTFVDRAAGSMQRFDALFVQLMAHQPPAVLRRTAVKLRTMAEAYASKVEFPAANDNQPETPLDLAVQALADSLWGQAAPAALPAPQSATHERSGQGRLSILFDRLYPGKAVLITSLALALCAAIGYSARWADERSHWYWIPMTVFIVMKPDLGSIFGRSVLRCAGTSVGVVIGALILALVPAGPIFVLIMGLAAACLPWAAQRSYALFALVLTPLVLVLIDFVSPETKDVNYAVLRFVDTLIGAAIVLIFGYLPLPKTHHAEMAKTFQDARNAIGAYLLATLPSATQAATAPSLGLERRLVYGKLADMRAVLQKSMSEPPPAGRAAAAWFPLITSAERVCDAITRYSALASSAPDATDLESLERLAKVVAVSPRATDQDLALKGKDSDSPEAQLIADIVGELAHMRVLTEPAHA